MLHDGASCYTRKHVLQDDERPWLSKLSKQLCQQLLHAVVYSLPHAQSQALVLAAMPFDVLAQHPDEPETLDPTPPSHGGALALAGT